MFDLNNKRQQKPKTNQEWRIQRPGKHWTKTMGEDNKIQKTDNNER